jgi:hypothetical protein
MNRPHTGFAAFTLLSLLMFVAGSTAPLQAQEVTDPNVLKGIDLFYSARFEESVEILQQAVIDNVNLTGDDRFAAFLYLGFCRIRQNADDELITMHLTEAIRIDPDIQLDAEKIPPDLFERFLSIRPKVLGGLIIVTDPPAASILLVEPGSNRIRNEYAPTAFHNLFEGSYELFVAKEDYETEISTVQIKAGVTDTLVFRLAKNKKPIYKRWWAWGGGLVTGYLIYELLDRDEGEKPRPSSDLPAPPQRP